MLRYQGRVRFLSSFVNFWVFQIKSTLIHSHSITRRIIPYIRGDKSIREVGSRLQKISPRVTLTWSKTWTNFWYFRQAPRIRMLRLFPEIGPTKIGAWCALGDKNTSPSPRLALASFSPRHPPYTSRAIEFFLARLEKLNKRKRGYAVWPGVQITCVVHINMSVCIIPTSWFI